ncbi:sucrose-6-phosphate hydrolase [Streptococcus himalayensis]|uniref:Sucrose-6-phosphate hydrolase n=1 Tax=Streptococcus himalayensis TaxID=1888195 RepID=A0A917EG50_9STRE|nr:sucrose-6-phosphate hydrolase [Streptococcus himalayensis]GGE35841.1 invertase [Streptococcus himalayensis]
MTWTTEKRYRRYEDWTKEECQNIKETIASSPWRATYHVEPETGLLNDPNGFSYFDGKWVVFYQNFPFGAAHGLKSWVQLESEDLVHFTPTGVKVLPDTDLDSHGAYSGSAMQFGDKLFLFYTGNVRDENWIRHPYQIGALLDKQGNLTKIDKVLIEQPEEATDHFRDPQIFTYHDQYYTIVGGQTKDKKGYIKLYKAVDNDYSNWEVVGDLNFENDNTAYMMECPNLVFIDEQPVLLYCPQGLAKDVYQYDNIYPNMYKIGQSFDTDSATMVNPGPLLNLDYGFECYATQAFNAPDGRALAVSWLGLPDVEYPSDRFNHQGTFSLVKELTLKDGKLYQYPVAAITDLRSHKEELADKCQTNNTYELELEIPANEQTELILFADQDGKGLQVLFDTENGLVSLDRSQAGEQYALDFGTKRTCPIDNQSINVNIFIDKSVFELFINKGEKVFSGRVFPNQDQTGILLKQGNPTGHYYELEYGRKTN